MRWWREGVVAYDVLMTAYSEICDYSLSHIRYFSDEMLEQIWAEWVDLA